MAASGVEHIFFDCDDSLYRNNWGTATKLNAQFAAYCSSNLGVPEDKMMSLYKTHGTTLCGLIREGFLEDEQVPDFLDKVHDISLDDIQPDPELRSLLLKIPHRRWVFTAATLEHATRCLRRMGIEDCFEGIIACSTKEMFGKAGYVSKHDPRCFEVAMDVAGVDRAEAAKCMLLDDSASNLKTAKAMGWSTVLVGLCGKNGLKVDQQNADAAVDNIHEIQQVVPQLFVPQSLKICQKINTHVSSTDAQSEGLKPLASGIVVEHVFFDCDDSLYRNDWGTATKLNAQFAAYCSSNLGVPESKMMSLYKTHGTTLCGLIRESFLEDEQVPDFLGKVHDISLDDIQPDPELRTMLLKIPHRRWVFTAATLEHATRCLQRMGIEDCFEGIIACSTRGMFEKAGYVSKHDPRCFEVAMDVAGVKRDEAAKCMLLDDSASNLKTAKAMGWSTVLVGLCGKDGSKVDQQNADAAVDNICEIQEAVPQLFVRQPLKICQKSMEFEVPLKRARSRVLKPFASSPERRVLRRVSTPLSPAHGPRFPPFSITGEGLFPASC